MGEYRSTRGEKPPATKSEKSRFRVKLLIWIVVIIAILYAAGVFIRLPHRIPASGYATTFPYAEARAPAAGRVAKIFFFSGDTVKMGDVLVQLDNRLELAELERATTEANRCEAELVYAKAEIAEEHRALSNRVAVASLSLDYARKRLEVTRKLSKKGLASSRDEMADIQQVALSELEFRRLNEQDNSLGELRLATLQRQYEASQANVSRAQASLDARTIRAPAAGTVMRHTFFVGEVVRPDQVLYEIFGSDRKLLRLRVPERYATKLREGQTLRAQFRTDRKIFHHAWVSGTVDEMRDVIQAEGNETYRVIYCSYDVEAADVPPGTTADAEILVGRLPLWRAVFDH